MKRSREWTEMLDILRQRNGAGGDSKEFLETLINGGLKDIMRHSMKEEMSPFGMALYLLDKECLALMLNRWNGTAWSTGELSLHPISCLARGLEKKKNESDGDSKELEAKGFEMLRMLFKHGFGGTPTEVDDWSRTPINWMIGTDWLEGCSFLLSNGHGTATMIEEGFRPEIPPLFSVMGSKGVKTHRNLRDMMSLLLRFGEDPMLTDVSGLTVVERAISRNDVEVLNILEEHGVEIFNGIRNPITIAVGQKAEEALEWILKRNKWEARDVVKSLKLIARRESDEDLNMGGAILASKGLKNELRAWLSLAKAEDEEVLFSRFESLELQKESPNDGAPTKQRRI